MPLRMLKSKFSSGRVPSLECVGSRMPSSKFVLGLITLVTSLVPEDSPEPDIGTMSVDSMMLMTGMSLLSVGRVLR